MPGTLPAEKTAPRSLPGNRRRQVAFILAVFLFSRLVVAMTGLVAWNHFGNQPPPPGFDPLPHGSLPQLFLRADAVHYLELTDRGYYYEPDPDSGWYGGNLGFYPVYPLLVRAARLLVPNTLLAGYLVSNALLLAACFLLWEVALLEFRSTTAAAWTLGFLLFCPGAAWLSMVFTESPFLLWLLGLVWSCRRQHWWLAAAAGLLLPLTRAVGVVTVVFVALEIWTDWRERQRDGAGRLGAADRLARAVAVAAPVVGYLAFFVFLYLRFGDWHAQHKVVACAWPANAQLVAPWTAIARDWAMMHNGKRLIIYGLLAAGYALAVLSWLASRRPSYPALALALITMCVVATNHTPLPRYLSVVVPLHLTLGWLATRSAGFGWAALGASAALMVFITGVMVSNGYVFY